MISFLSILAIGFFLGMRHATDPDHVIAVTTIVSRQRKLSRAALIGAYWGLGHTLTILIVGSGIILFSLVIPPRIGLSMELSVGLMLVLLGVMNVAGFLRSIPSPAEPGEAAIVHSHPHAHEGVVHTHVHNHAGAGHSHVQSEASLAWLDRTFGQSRSYGFLRPLVIGIVHGLAGSAAVALLVLTTIRDPRLAIAYLLIFGVGTIAGMMLITMSLASAFHFLGAKFRNFSRGLAMASGVLSVAFGIFVIYQIGFSDGLFTSHPRWTPN